MPAFVLSHGSYVLSRASPLDVLLLNRVAADHFQTLNRRRVDMVDLRVSSCYRNDIDWGYRLASRPLGTHMCIGPCAKCS